MRRLMRTPLKMRYWILSPSSLEQDFDPGGGGASDLCLRPITPSAKCRRFCLCGTWTSRLRNSAPLSLTAGPSRTISEGSNITTPPRSRNLHRPYIPKDAPAHLQINNHLNEAHHRPDFLHSSNGRT